MKVAVSFTASDNPFILDFSTLSGVSGTFGEFAVLAAAGHFGVGGLEYTLVPEPSTLLLAGTGLVGLGAWLRRRRTDRVG